MQEKTIALASLADIGLYNFAMPRALTRKRPKLGAKLADLRKEAGLSQYELAKLIGVPQSNIAFWELSDKPPRSDVVPRLAKTLGVSADTLLSANDDQGRRRNGPVGKTRKAFEDVAALPRRQQDKIVEIVNALVGQYRKA